ncbi:MAG: lysophospholipid acyltransferase family protein [Bacteroidales bacterium]
MKYIFNYLLFPFFLFIVKISNKHVLIKLSSILGILAFKVLKVRKETVLHNLQEAFPDFSEEKIYEIALKNYKSFALTFFEFAKLKYATNDSILNEVEFVNNKVLEKALSRKDSLILLTAHFGNWEYGALCIGLKYNFPMRVLAKKQSNEFVTKFMSEAREKFGNKEIFTGSSVKELYKALLNKQIIGVVGDQRGSVEGPRVKFFNKDTAVYTGTAVLSLKTSTPILTVFVARQKDNKYKIFIDELSFDDLPENQEEKVLEINQRYFAKLEKMIKQYPEQWFWMHKIWKY